MDENCNKKHFGQGFLGAFGTDQHFHDYILREYCGCGAYGEVWQAEDISGRLLAIKIVSKKMYGTNWQREFNGIKNYCRLISNHPNLIQIMHVGEDDKYFFYTMELADNLAELGKPYYADTLADRLAANGTFPPEQLVILTKYLLNGVGTLHKAGLIHRDIKPANIIFVNGMPKLSDIGFVVQRDANTSIAGTIGFIPPEELLGENDSSTEKNTHYDIYALGKVMYCALTRLPPDEFPLLPEFVTSDIGKRLSQVIDMACCRNPSERIGSIDEFRQLLLMAANGDENIERQANGTASPGLSLTPMVEKISAAVIVVIAIVILAGLFMLKGRTETPVLQDSGIIASDGKATPQVADVNPVRMTTKKQPSMSPVPVAPTVVVVNPAADTSHKPASASTELPPIPAMPAAQELTPQKPVTVAENERPVQIKMKNDPASPTHSVPATAVNPVPNAIEKNPVVPTAPVVPPVVPPVATANPSAGMSPNPASASTEPPKIPAAQELLPQKPAASAEAKKITSVNKSNMRDTKNKKTAVPYSVTEYEWQNITDTFFGGSKQPSGIILKNQGMYSKDSYAPPLEIEYVCKTNSTNIRLAYACDQLIFNWELNANELRIDGGPVGGQHRMGAGRVPVNKFVTIRQVVNKDRMDIFVDEKLCASWPGDFSKIKSSIGIAPAHLSIVTVKSIKIKSL